MILLRSTLIFISFFISIDASAGELVIHKGWMYDSEQNNNFFPRISTLSLYNIEILPELFHIDYDLREPDDSRFEYGFRMENWDIFFLDEISGENDLFLCRVVIDGDEKNDYFLLIKRFSFVFEIPIFSGIHVNESLEPIGAVKLIEKFKEGSSFRIEFLSSNPDRTPLIVNNFTLKGFSETLEYIQLREKE